jgi:ElaB protein
MMERTAASSAALANELRIVLQQVEELIHAIGDDRDDALKEIRNRVNGVVGNAKDRLADMEKRAQVGARRARTVARAYARDNPWTTLSIGAAVGLILGAILVPKRSRRTEHKD